MIIPTLVIKSLDSTSLILTAQKLPATGIMEQRGNYSFLRIADNFIHDLYPLLSADSGFTPGVPIIKPDYFSPPYDIGAHITFIYPEENVVLDAGDIGQEHSFAVQGLYSALLGDKEYFVVTVASPSLTNLRAKYKLHAQPQYKNNRIDFHVTVGIRKIRN